MRAKIMLISGSETALGLSLFVQQVLTDLAVAFGHSFVITEERGSALSRKEYGSPMTEETVEAADACDAALWLAPDESGLAELCDGLRCILACHVFWLPEELRGLSLLKSGVLARGILASPLSDGEEDLRRSMDRLRAMAGDRGLALSEIPYAGERGERWQRAVRTAAERGYPLNRSVTNAPDFIRKTIEDPASMGVLLATPSACAGTRAVAEALCGQAAGLCYSLYPEKRRVRLYSVRVPDRASADETSPLGALFAVCELLKTGLGLAKEAEFLSTCCDNVLHAGWRTSDLAAESGRQPITAEGMIRLISEQIELVAALGQR